jgi:hypothetical protein
MSAIQPRAHYITDLDAQYGLHKLVLGKTFDDHYLTVAKKKTKQNGILSPIPQVKVLVVYN